jgi:5-methyltetrahydropteroyltriglutamate--homocysteine methyltransferase
MELRSSLTGPYPRSEPLVAATRDLDRGRTTPEAVEALFRAAEREIAAKEAQLGLSSITAGYLRWADLFRPIAESWGGFSVGPVTRYFATNTFYRQPILHHPPERAAGSLRRALPAASGAAPAGRAHVLLPGPYTLASALDNRSGETPEALIHRLGRLLAEELVELRAAGYATFQFQEPALVVRPPRGPAAESVGAAYRAIGAAATGATTLVWTYFADAAPAFPLLAKLPVTAVGIDLAETDVAQLPVPERPIGLGLGCIDPRTTLREDPAEIASIVRAAEHALGPTRIWLGPGAPLDLLPYGPAGTKIEVLAAARALLAPEGAR